MDKLHDLTNKFVTLDTSRALFEKNVQRATCTEYLSPSSRRIYSSDLVLVYVVTTNGYL